MASCPLGHAAEPASLTRFLSRQLDEPTSDDVAELSQLLAASRRPANVAFLSKLHPKQHKLAAAATLDDKDVAELRKLMVEAKRDASVAALSPALVGAASTVMSPDTHEALYLGTQAKRPRVRGMMKLIAARIAADDAREEHAGGADLKGCPVRIVNLQSRPQLNQTRGLLVAYVQEAGRYRVLVKGQSLSLRAANVQLLAPDAPEVDEHDEVDEPAPHKELPKKSVVLSEEEEEEKRDPEALAQAMETAESVPPVLALSEVLPPSESTVLLLAGPGTVGSAHLIAQVL